MQFRLLFCKILFSKQKYEGKDPFRKQKQAFSGSVKKGKRFVPQKNGINESVTKIMVKARPAIQL